MSISELERQLASAQRRLKQVLNSATKLPESLAAFEAVASAQRELAAARGEEYAVRHDIGFEPEAAVSEAVLLQAEHAAILTFRATRAMPDWKREDAGYGVVELDRCELTKFGYPNDEALPGHPLRKRTL